MELFIKAQVQQSRVPSPWAYRGLTVLGRHKSQYICLLSILTVTYTPTNVNVFNTIMWASVVTTIAQWGVQQHGACTFVPNPGLCEYLSTSNTQNKCSMPPLSSPFELRCAWKTRQITSYHGDAGRPGAQSYQAFWIVTALVANHVTINIMHCPHMRRHIEASVTDDNGTNGP